MWSPVTIGVITSLPVLALGATIGSWGPLGPASASGQAPGHPRRCVSSVRFNPQWVSVTYGIWICLRPGEALWAWGSPQVSASKGGEEWPHVGRAFLPPGSESGGDIGDEASPLLCSFVRSVTMDKWKDVELEKMIWAGMPGSESS